MEVKLLLTENNFAEALKVLGFTEKSSGLYEKIFENVNAVMRADLNEKKLFFPAQVKGRERNNTFNESLRENLVVFECVNRLLEKGYRPEHIELEKLWSLGREQKSGRADIIVYNPDGETLFIVECKTFGAEYEKEFANMQLNGGQLFSYWQQEQNAKWLILYASNFTDGKINYKTDSVSVGDDTYKNAHNVEEHFEIWSEVYEKKFCGDVIFRSDTVAYQIGVKPLCKGDLSDFAKNIRIVNRFEEILRHNNVSDKENAFNRIIALFICKLVDEIRKTDDQEVDFQYKIGTDTYETLQDRLQKLHHEGMEQFMHENVFYVSDDYAKDIIQQYTGQERENLIAELEKTLRRLKFYTNNDFAFMDVHNEELFYKNGKILVEVVRIFQDYKIIGSKNLQTLGDLFEQLLDKGFKQDEGQFFTPIPLTRFIWDALPLDEIIFGGDEVNIPKIIDYACGAGHFLTQGFQAVEDCFKRNNFELKPNWEIDKIFGVEKDYRLARVSKIACFMHGINNGKIKFGDGLENYPDENIFPNAFNILVANPPYAVDGFKPHLKLKNTFSTLDKVSNDGSEIETLFVERISQLLKSDGVAAVILPSSILNKNGASFIAARESLLQNFYLRAVVQLKGKTFGATGTNTVILFLQRMQISPDRFNLVADSVNFILRGVILDDWEDKEIFNAYTKKIGVDAQVYLTFVSKQKNYSDWRDNSYFGGYVAKFESSSEFKNKLKQNSFKNLSDDKKFEWLNQKFYELAFNVEAEKIRYFAMTYKQTTLIISAPDDNALQEKFLGYKWSNRKGDEGIKDDRTGGLLFDYNNRAATDKLSAVIRKAFIGEKISVPNLQNYFYYLNLADMIDFSGTNFTKIIRLNKETEFTYSGKFPLEKLCKIAEIIQGTSPKSEFYNENGEGLPFYQGKKDFGEIYLNKSTIWTKNFIKNSIQNDILMSVRAPVGDVNKNPFEKICIGRGLAAIRCFDSEMQDYIFYYLRFSKKMITGHKGSTFDSISGDEIRNLKIPVPPLEEQKKIVSEFEEIDEKIETARKEDKEKFLAEREKLVEKYFR